MDLDGFDELRLLLGERGGGYREDYRGREEFGHGVAIIISVMTVTINPDILAELEEKAKSEQRDVDAVVNELLRQALDAKKPYKLELNGWTWKGELPDDISPRKMYDLLYDDPEYLRKRGFIP